MIVSHKYKFVFLHNPKVGGTSVRDALLPYADVDTYRFCGYVDSTVQDISHLRVDQWPEELWRLYAEGYFFFGLVRDPIDRFMSAMSEFRHQHVETQFCDLEALLPRLLTTNSILHDWRFIHFSPQWSYFALDRGRIDVPQIFLADIRNIERDLGSEEFARHLNLPEPLQITNGRPSFYRPKEISEELKSFAAALYQDDYCWLASRGFYFDSPEPKVGPTHAHRLDAVHAKLLDGTNYPPYDGITERCQKWERTAIERQTSPLRSHASTLLVEHLERMTKARSTRLL